MSKIISFMHISFDGFVAGPNGEMDWIKVDDEIFDHVGKRIGESNTALYGRITYQMMESYWPTAADKPNASKHDIEHSKWYKHARKIVLSRTMDASDSALTEVVNDHLVETLDEIKQKTDGEILLFGSPTATYSLFQLGLIDGYWLFVNPIILGQGIPLFVGSKERIHLQLLDTHTFTNGVVALNYVVDKK